MRGVLLVAVLLVSLAQAPAPPPFSELETARLDALQQENRALDAEQRLLNLQRERLTAKVSAFKAEAERQRPGWVWEPDTGKWTEKKGPS